MPRYVRRSPTRASNACRRRGTTAPGRTPRARNSSPLPVAHRDLRDRAPTSIIAANGANESSMTHSPLVWVGLGGVPADDNEAARRWQDRLHWIMVAVALLSVPA